MTNYGFELTAVQDNARVTFNGIPKNYHETQTAVLRVSRENGEVFHQYSCSWDGLNWKADLELPIEEGPASLTMRVPAEQLDAFLTGVEAYGRITSRSETTEDMTEQYSDNEMRIQTLRTKMERLQTLLSQAENVSDMLKIESVIADTQYDLDRLEGRQLNIDRRVDMSYVYVNVQESVVQDDVDDEELTLGQRLQAAFKASVEGLGRFGRNLLVFLVMAAPVIVPVALIVLIVKLVKRGKKAKVEEHDLMEDLLQADTMDESDEENE